MFQAESKKKPLKAYIKWDRAYRSESNNDMNKYKPATVKSLSRVRLSDPMDCSLPGSSVHGIFQARVLEWGAIAFSCSLPESK